MTERLRQQLENKVLAIAQMPDEDKPDAINKLAFEIEAFRAVNQANTLHNQIARGFNGEL